MKDGSGRKETVDMFTLSETDAYALLPPFLLDSGSINRTCFCKFEREFRIHLDERHFAFICPARVRSNDAGSWSSASVIFSTNSASVRLCV